MECKSAEYLIKERRCFHEKERGKKKKRKKKDKRKRKKKNYGSTLPPFPFLRGTFVRIYASQYTSESGSFRFSSSRGAISRQFRESEEPARRANELQSFGESSERRRVEWHRRYRGAGPSRRPS